MLKDKKEEENKHHQCCEYVTKGSKTHVFRQTEGFIKMMTWVKNSVRTQVVVIKIVYIRKKITVLSVAK